jgi:hypothetical protein
MPKHFKQRESSGNIRKVNVIIEEYKEDDGVTVHKINPDIYIEKKGKQSFDEELSNVIALFNKSLHLKPF